MRYSVVPFLKNYATYGEVPEEHKIGAFVIDLRWRRKEYEREPGGAVIDDDLHHHKMCECESVNLAITIADALNKYASDNE